MAGVDSEDETTIVTEPGRDEPESPPSEWDARWSDLPQRNRFVPSPIVHR